MKTTLTILALLFFLSCGQDKHQADLVLINGNIHTMDDKLPTAEAMAIRDQKIIDIGKNDDIKKYISSGSTRIIDLQNAFTMPGLIEGHGHFTGLGQSLINLNFLQSKNWDEIVDEVAEAAKKAKPGEWISGRGWHQEKWDKTPEQQVHGYPFHYDLSDLTKDNPVVLFHASGHSLYANQKAMEHVNITTETPNPAGGEIVKDADGNPIGVFEERAMDAFRVALDEYQNTISEDQRQENWLKAIRLAQDECLKNGVTSFQDAGSTFAEIKKFQALEKANELDLRLWVMLRQPYEDMVNQLSGFPYISDYLSIRAIKTQVDGALGAFGAWLLKPYNDKPGFEGQNTTTVTEVKNIAKLAKDNEMQLCVHAIGDRANRVTLNIMEEAFGDEAKDNNYRWRIEHAQHLNPKDIPRFKSLGVIASMQGIHCTSDAPFVVKRLGMERAQKGAYAWRSLIDAGVAIANGTDAPVEDVDPFACLYASVTRKRTDTQLEFFKEQSMTRKEALLSYTKWNAWAAFEEDTKGTLSIGKLADIVVLNNNLLTCSDEEILTTDVIYTIVGGDVKYANVK